MSGSQTVLVESTIAQETEIIKNALAYLDDRDSNVWLAVSQRIALSIRAISQVVTVDTLVSPVVIAAAQEFADAEERMKRGIWPNWGAIRQPTDSITKHAWYKYGRTPPVPEGASLSLNHNPSATLTNNSSTLPPSATSIPSTSVTTIPTSMPSQVHDSANLAFTTLEKGKQKETGDEMDVDILDNDPSQASKGEEKGGEEIVEVVSVEVKTAPQSNSDPSRHVKTEEEDSRMIPGTQEFKTDQNVSSAPIAGSSSHPTADDEDNERDDTDDDTDPRCDKCKSRNVACIPFTKKGVCKECKRQKTKCTLAIPVLTARSRSRALSRARSRARSRATTRMTSQDDASEEEDVPLPRRRGRPRRRRSPSPKSTGFIPPRPPRRPSNTRMRTVTPPQNRSSSSVAQLKSRKRQRSTSPGPSTTFHPANLTFRNPKKISPSTTSSADTTNKKKQAPNVFVEIAVPHKKTTTIPQTVAPQGTSLANENTDQITGLRKQIAGLSALVDSLRDDVSDLRNTTIGINSLRGELSDVRIAIDSNGRYVEALRRSILALHSSPNAMEPHRLMSSVAIQTQLLEISQEGVVGRAPQKHPGAVIAAPNVSQQICTSSDHQVAPPSINLPISATGPSPSRSSLKRSTSVPLAVRNLLDDVFSRHSAPPFLPERSLDHVAEASNILGALNIHNNVMDNQQGETIPMVPAQESDRFAGQDSAVDMSVEMGSAEEGKIGGSISMDVDLGTPERSV